MAKSHSPDNSGQNSPQQPNRTFTVNNGVPVVPGKVTGYTKFDTKSDNQSDFRLN